MRPLCTSCHTRRRSSPLFWVLLGIMPAQQAAAAFPSLGTVTSASVEAGKLVVAIGSDQLSVAICSPTILQVDYLRQGTVDPPTPVVDFKHEWPGDSAATIDISSDPIEVKTSRMRLEISRSPCRLSLYDQHENHLLWEPGAGGMFVEDPAASSDAHGGLRFLHNSNHHYYGAKAYGLDDYYIGSPTPNVDNQYQVSRDGRGIPNNTYLTNAAKQGGAGAPGIWSTAGYGLLVDSDNGYLVVNDSQLEFYYGEPKQPDNPRRYTRNNSIEFFLLVGSPKELLKAMAQISGPAPMFPRWAMGFTNSQWGIIQREFYDIVDGYRARDIPIDNFTFDFDWKAWGEDNFGEFRFNAGNFPDALLPGPAGFGSLLAANADQRSVKLTGIMKPRLIRCTDPNAKTPLTLQASQAQMSGFWYPGMDEHNEYLSPFRYVGELDFSLPACRQWYWNAMQSHQAIDQGIAGYWNDEADAAGDRYISNLNFNNFEHFHMQQALYEGQRASAASPKATQRVWSLNRNFYLGAQRFGYATWSGDINTGFSSMQQQPVRMLSTVALGQPKWGMDTGGFNGGDPNHENYARWIQFSSLVPVFRVHGNQNSKRYPWAFNFQSEETAKSAIRFRYRLAPYIYACDRECLDSGVGLVRPLFVEFPNDAGSAAVSDEWMLGEWLLAAPVLREQDSAGNGDNRSIARSIYLPPGQWIDFNRGDKLTGGAMIDYGTNAGVWSDVPLFVRAGGLLLSQDVVPSLGKVRPAVVEVDAFASSTASSTTFYDDDGATYDYESGNFCKQRITLIGQGISTSITVEAKEGRYASSVSNFLVRLHGRAAQGVTLEGTAQALRTDVAAIKSAGSGWAIGLDVYGPVTFVMVPAGAGTNQTIVASGSQSPTATAEQFEAEDASLAGLSLATRPGVNNNHHGFSGAGFVDKFENLEARITFYARVRSPGRYDVTLRAANATGQTGTLSVFVNGVAQGVATVVSQADWDTWTDVPLKLALAAGNNFITFRQLASDTGRMNLDYLAVPFWPATEQYELESATLVGTAEVNWNHLNYNGIGFIDKLESPGSGLKLSVVTPGSGTYTLSTRYANGTGSAQTMSLYVNGAKIKSTSFAPTANWDTWATETETVLLGDSPNSLGFQFDAADSGHINLDTFKLGSSGSD